MRYPTLRKILIAFILLFSAAFLFTGIIFLIKYFLITLSGLQEPVFKWVKMLLTEEKIKNGLLFHIILIGKIVSLFLAGAFIFMLYSALSAVLSFIFYNLCSWRLKKISHPLKFALIKGVKWNFYRIFLIVSPPIFIQFAGIFLVSSLIILFNLFLKIAGISITLTTFFVTFFALSIMFLFMLSLLLSLWQLFSTIYGTEIAISEPRLSYKTIAKRSKKLIFTKRYSIFLCISYLALILSIIFQIKYALSTNIFIRPSSQEFLNIIIMINVFCILVFEYLKSSGYINSLLEHNQKVTKCPVKVIRN